MLATFFTYGFVRLSDSTLDVLHRRENNELSLSYNNLIKERIIGMLGNGDVIAGKIAQTLESDRYLKIYAEMIIQIIVLLDFVRQKLEIKLEFSTSWNNDYEQRIGIIENNIGVQLFKMFDCLNSLNKEIMDVLKLEDVTNSRKVDNYLQQEFGKLFQKYEALKQNKYVTFEEVSEFNHVFECTRLDYQFIRHHVKPKHGDQTGKLLEVYRLFQDITYKRTLRPIKEESLSDNEELY